MPTTLVSFIGTGRKRDRNDPRSAYEKTAYEFRLDGTQPIKFESSFFGIALLHALRQRGEHVARWVVLGTSASLWPELIGLVEDQDPLLDQYVKLDDKVLSRTVCEEDLDAWQRTVNGAQSLVEVRCCMVDEALTKDGQTRIAGHLLEQVPRDCDVVFDVSHGFRHQPIIATHVVSMMRWTHVIRSIRFFSGVLEASRDGVAPAVELPICQQLAETTEALATLELTGNYESLAKRIGLDASIAWFYENTNQIHRASELLRGLGGALKESSRQTADPIKAEAANLLRKSLGWTDGVGLANRYQDAAKTALSHHDFARWAVLAYESLCVLALEKFFVDGEPLEHDHRIMAAEELARRLSPSERRTWKFLKNVRNACAHGSRSRVGKTQSALSGPEKFQPLVDAATHLFKRLSKAPEPRRVSISSIKPGKKAKPVPPQTSRHGKSK